MNSLSLVPLVCSSFLLGQMPSINPDSLISVIGAYGLLVIGVVWQTKKLDRHTREARDREDRQHALYSELLQETIAQQQKNTAVFVLMERTLHGLKNELSNLGLQAEQLERLSELQKELKKRDEAAEG